MGSGSYSHATLNLVFHEALFQTGKIILNFVFNNLLRLIQNYIGKNVYTTSNNYLKNYKKFCLKKFKNNVLLYFDL